MKNYISIIIPTYNSKKFIKETLQSIENQTYKNYEIILVDDCSTDGTFKLLQKIQEKNYGKIRLYRTKKNSGTVSTPRNLGVKKAKGDLICFCDSDDIWKINKLEEQIKDIKKKKIILTTAAEYFSNNVKSSFGINFLRRLIQLYIIRNINLKGFQWLYLYNPIIVSSVMIYKKDLITNIFDEGVNAREDLDLWIRLRKKNYKFIFTNKILTSIRRREESLSSNTRRELITIINTLSSVLLKSNSFKKLNFFLLGIITKFIISFVRINIIKIKKIIRFSLFSLITLLFLVFYTPAFWYLGSPLLYKDNFDKNENIKNLVVFSGHGSTSYYNITYRYRYLDIKKILDNYNNVENIFILGRVSEIPEQKIIESLLITDGFDSDKIHLIYQEYNNTSDNIKYISTNLIKKDINEIVFITSPYHSKRAKLLWDKAKKIKVRYWKGYEWPKKNNFFTYSKNKKIIIFEYLSIIYNKFKGNI
jgi:teichuronic acid biosynthesis glycosyltransferase TuaG